MGVDNAKNKAKTRQKWGIKGVINEVDNPYELHNNWGWEKKINGKALLLVNPPRGGCKAIIYHWLTLYGNPASAYSLSDIAYKHLRKRLIRSKDVMNAKWN